MIYMRKKETEPEVELGLHIIEKTFSQKIEETKAKIYDGALRAGNRIEYEGTIIVLGDVNAGAEVISGENVIVLGAIRGLAHAGASGNKEAIIVCNEIDAPQIRIADIVKEIEKTENGDGEEKIKKKRAYIKRSQIILE